MVHDDFDYVFEDFMSARGGTSSDYRYVLRKMLQRGISEAYYRFRISEGAKAVYYKYQSYELEDIRDEIDGMIDEDGLVLPDHRMTVMRAIKMCQCLLAIDQAETNADYDNLAAYLTDDLCDECRADILAA